MSNGRMLNCTGSELPNDMACPSTIECYAIEADSESIFFDEDGEYSIVDRARLIKEWVDKYSGWFDRLIVSNNALGRDLIELMPAQKFVISNKQANGLHWYYSNTDRLTAVNTPEVNDSMDMNSEHYSPLAEKPVETYTPKVPLGVNIGQLPTDEDMARLGDSSILDKNIPYRATTPEEGLREEVILARIQQALDKQRDEMGKQILNLQRQIGHYRRGHGNLAEEIFETIKHGDEKHQRWLQEALRSFFDGQQPLTEEVVARIDAALDRVKNTGAVPAGTGKSEADFVNIWTPDPKAGEVINPRVPTPSNVVESRIPASVHMVNGSNNDDQ